MFVFLSCHLLQTMLNPRNYKISARYPQCHHFIPLVYLCFFDSVVCPHWKSLYAVAQSSSTWILVFVSLSFFSISLPNLTRYISSCCLVCPPIHRSKMKDIICSQRPKILCWMLYFWLLKDLVLALLRWPHLFPWLYVGNRQMLFASFLNWIWLTCYFFLSSSPAIDSSLSCSLHTSTSCCRARQTFWEAFL